ncbi:MAG: L,D-transpeptidase family protein [Alphaproteobacteria bacterium]|nr:L,D-transpeptidase family protein [Alphaproteobacteria bacterium]
MLIHVSADGWLDAGAHRYRCALGRGGIGAHKQEGDGITPAGRFPLRRLLYRADRLARPDSKLATSAIQPDDGWCDDPADAAYNQPVRLPYGASAESLWRKDGLYDLVVILGHNDAPVVPGAGSAIFMHVASPGHGPTEGCVALARDDLLALLPELDGDTEIQFTV